MTGYSSVALVYGVCVEVPDLVAAGRAFAAVQPALLALEMIARRREHGALSMEVASSAPVERVPSEVWTIIKQCAVAQAVADARWWLHQDACSACAAGAGAARGSWMLSAGWMGHGDGRDEEDHMEEVAFANGDMSDMLWQPEIRTLLGQYDLYLPISTNLHPNPIHFGPQPHLAALALRPRDARGAVVRPAVMCDAEPALGHEAGASRVVEVPPTVFALPAHADSAVARFLGEWHVRPVRRSVPLGPAWPMGRYGQGNDTEEAIARSALAPAEPRWMLVQSLYVNTV